MHRSTARSRPDPKRDDGPLADRLRELARRHPRYGCLTPPRMLKREGLVATRKRKRRACSRLGLQVRTKRRRRPQRPRVRMAMPTRPNERWPTGFMSGQLASGRRLRIPDVAAGFSRPRVGQLVATSTTGGPAGTLPGQAGQDRDAGFHPARQARPERFRGGLQRQVPDSCLNQHWFSASWTTGTTTATMTAARFLGLSDARRAREASRLKCLFTLLATGPVLGGRST